MFPGSTWGVSVRLEYGSGLCNYKEYITEEVFGRIGEVVYIHWYIYIYMYVVKGWSPSESSTQLDENY